MDSKIKTILGKMVKKSREQQGELDSLETRIQDNEEDNIDHAALISAVVSYLLDLEVFDDQEFWRYYARCSATLDQEIMESRVEEE